MKLKILGCAVLMAFSGTSQAETESLADIYRLALLNDPQYRRAEVDLNIGKNSTYKAWANFLPKLNLDPTGSYSRNTSADLEQTINGLRNPVIPGGKSVRKAANLGRLSFNIGIDQWFTFKNDLMGDEHAQLRFAQAQQQLIIRVTEKYFNVLEAHANLQIAQKSLEESRLNLDLAEERLAEGLNTITDTHKAKTDYYSAQIEAQQKMVDLDQAFEALTLLTGKPHYDLSGFGNKIPAPDPSPLNSEQWVRSAVQDSYEVKIKKIEREQARNNNKKSKHYYLPTVTASLGGADYSSSPASTQISTATIQNPDGTITEIEQVSTTPAIRSYREGGDSLRVQLSIPLFGDNGLSLIDRREKAQMERISHENFLKSYRQTEFDVRTSFMNILNQKRRLKLEEKRLEQAKLAYEKTKIEYEHGSKSLIELTNEQNSLFRAQNSRTEVQYGYIESLLKLKEQAGKLTPEDIFEIDSWLNDENKIIATQRNTLPVDADSEGN